MEKTYAQIEKELLALSPLTHRSHQYVCRVRANVQSEHRPLGNILRKPLATSPSRLQLMLVQLQCYELNIRYTPGKDLLIADTLSHKTIT